MEDYTNIRYWLEELIKLMREENLKIPVSKLSNKQFQYMLKSEKVELDRSTDNFIIKED